MRTHVKRPSASMVIAMLALCLAIGGTAIAVPGAADKKPVSKKTVKKIANKQIKKKAPGLHVASADNATNADHATNADNATTADNANQLGGQPLDAVRSTSGSAQNAAVVNIGGGTDVVTAQITTTATSRLLISGSAELSGAEADERATCTLRLDGATVSLGFETTFDDIGANNEATLAAEAAQSDVPAGAHTVAMRCTALNGTVTKDDAAINVTSVPNP